MVDIFEHCTRLDTATVEERRDLVQVVPDGGELPCDSFDEQGRIHQAERCL